MCEQQKMCYKTYSTYIVNKTKALPSHNRCSVANKTAYLLKGKCSNNCGLIKLTTTQQNIYLLISNTLT